MTIRRIFSPFVPIAFPNVLSTTETSASRPAYRAATRSRFAPIVSASSGTAETPDA
jgi:hypothetical protein